QTTDIDWAPADGIMGLPVGPAVAFPAGRPRLAFAPRMRPIMISPFATRRRRRNRRSRPRRLMHTNYHSIHHTTCHTTHHKATFTTIFFEGIMFALHQPSWKRDRSDQHL